MAETRTNFVLLSSILQTIRSATVARKTFSVFVAGPTNEAHRDVVEMLKDVGLNEVMSPEDCDFLLSFCPVASRVGTDISEALNKMHGVAASKPAVLVVMHHSFDPEHAVAESSKLVNNPNVLAVDCLFNKDKFLECQRNDAAWLEVKKYLGVSTFQVLFWKTLGKFIRLYFRSPVFTWVLCGTLIYGLYYVKTSIIDVVGNVWWMMDL